MRKLRAALLILPVAFACNSIPELTGSKGRGSDDPGSSMGGAARGVVDIDPSLGGGNGMGGQGVVVVPNPCDDLNCGDGEYCLIEGSTASCEEHTCESLKCDSVATQTCIVSDDGPDSCKDIGCASNLECEASEYCDTDRGICIGSVCEPSASSCDGQSYQVCNSNGSQLQDVFTCGSGAAGFTSQCVEGAAGEDTGCTCIDDWDCPEYSHCEATTRGDGAFELMSTGPRIGVCVGTGKAPTCSLPTSDFRADNTDIEIQWGSEEWGDGNGGGRETVAANPNTPYPDHVQVVVTPTVANLDDDNGDGFIDEKDTPEIIFLAFEKYNVYTRNGVLRAIHGGGERKGEDYFASCGEGDGVGTANEERWTEDAFLTNGTGVLGGIVAGDGTCDDDEADMDATAGIAVGDLNYDGIPEIVVVGESASEPLYIYDNTGKRILTVPGQEGVGGANPYPTLVNIDGVGPAEIVVGDQVYQFDVDVDNNLQFSHYFHGGGREGRNAQGPVSCVADLDGDGTMEIIAGPQVYSLPDAGGEVDQSACNGTEWCDRDLHTEFIARDLMGVDLPDDGFCAVADILGEDPSLPPGPGNELDGEPDVALVANGVLYVFDKTGVSYISEELRTSRTSSKGGGAPNVDDFDGDGFPEIGTAGELGYVVFDLQEATDGAGACPAWTAALDPDAPLTNPNAARTPSGTCTVDSDCVQAGTTCNEITGQCICLHNGWESATIDNSSRVTGSSVFDFNGDGAAEVVYNDECKFRVYDGLSGEAHLQEWSESRTRIEYPIVADVDRDGNAEIIFATTTESKFCDNRNDEVSPGITAAETFNAGVEVWGDLNDLWVPARGIWNQHAYHVTNVTESGQIPMSEPQNWLSHNGRTYNTYRSNPRNYGVAPDLVVGEIQYLSPDAVCGVLGTTLDINALIRNDGDLLVGPDSVVSFSGTWAGTTEALLDASGMPLEVALGTSLDPRRSTYVTLLGYDPTFAGGNNRPTLPDSIVVRADAGSIETECNDEGFGDDNNSLSVDVTATGARPDFKLSAMSASCNSARAQISVTIDNVGTAEASSVEVAFYSGDPNSGGVELGRETIAGPLAAGASQQLMNIGYTIPTGRDVTIYAVVDPDNEQTECNDGNNLLGAPPINCGRIIIPR